MKKLLTFVTLFALPIFAFAGTIERVSISDASAEGDGSSANGNNISLDGRYVVFSSQATNLVSGDTNSFIDIFVYDRTLDVVERVSVNDLGVEGDSDSYNPSISSDGRYVAFESVSTNLVAGDTAECGRGANCSDVFVYDRDSNTIERVSVDDLGVEGNGASYNLSISSDCRYVAFSSESTNLVAGDTNNGEDVFVYDRDSNTIERVSANDLGVEGDNISTLPSISSDGRYVAFSSQATNLVAGDTNNGEDVFVYDRDSNTIERVSVNDLGVEGDNNSAAPLISSDGRYVAFRSQATNLVSGNTNSFIDVFVYDRTLDVVERVSVNDLGVEGDNNSTLPSISSDGRYVAFKSQATNLVSGDTNSFTDVFVYDRTLDVVERVSVNDLGVEGDIESYDPSISSDGRYVAFTSDATNLVSGDSNSFSDVFVWDRGAPPDTTTPTITILGDNPETITVGDTYTDAGATAEDDIDGDITGDIVVTNNVNTAVAGTYTVVYDVSDTADNAASEERTVHVVAAPVVEEDSGHSSSHRRSETIIQEATVPDVQDSEEQIMLLQTKLIELLTQLLAELMGTR